MPLQVLGNVVIGGGQVGMPQQLLNVIQLHARLVTVGRKSMTKTVRRDAPPQRLGNGLQASHFLSGNQRILWPTTPPLQRTDLRPLCNYRSG